MPETFTDFFKRITGNDILPYQARYANDPFVPTLLTVPTGLGKTDTVVLPWLYAHWCANPLAPTRLFLVLPRQNLTNQTAKVVREHVRNSDLQEHITVIELMAGSQDNQERLRPFQPTVIVSTQDMFFSRALNRGYARSPPHWPIDFALFNQDCLIVLDELQLMDDALATSLQLAAFRQRFATFKPAPSIWMSATVNPAWMQTVDFHQKVTQVELDEEDLNVPVVRKRFFASKVLKQAPEQCRSAVGCAAFVLERHRIGTRSLVIVNTVPRAREIYRAIRKTTEHVVLLHSRFRPKDRAANSAKLEDISREGQIVVATQVLEAGVDITSRMLVTDLAPWSSLVQRFGRVNRRGEDIDPEVWWVHDPVMSNSKISSSSPYSPAEVERALLRIQQLTSAAAADLPPEDGPVPWQHVLREADLLDLFDTTSDLSGNAIDVSRFIRASEDRNAYLAWRTWEGTVPPPETNDFDDGELCPVPLGELREFLRKHKVYSWNFATEEFQEVDQDTGLFAGLRALTRVTEGGYTAVEGWSPESKTDVTEVQPAQDAIRGDSSDRLSFLKYRQTLQKHTLCVMHQMELLLAKANLEAHLNKTLQLAALKHDWGKAHEVFQATMHHHDHSPELLAKQCGNETHCRKHFRHEFASALAMMTSGDPDLATYLVAAHHGRIRLGVRSMPGEAANFRRVRGIEDGDCLDELEIVPGRSLPAVTLSLACVELGAAGGSWVSRMLKVRDQLGPFRLAYLEMLLRIADQTASAIENSGEAPCPQ